MRVIGTAGHVDHGKSTLIQALTGIDPDRLQEEKERGMTIDLGFAWLRLPSGVDVSIVDVPGHERFIKNMLAGVGGIDIALLVVAADEGVMPQTREHTAILNLLGIKCGVVAITKKDLVEEEWLELVQEEVHDFLKDTSLAQAPLVPVSSVTRDGLDRLVASLEELLPTVPHRAGSGWPRLPIDRVFTVAGFGTVVTGTLVDGELKVGQEVEVLPQGLKTRIRGLQTHRKKVEVAAPSSRVAVNLSGVPTESLRRGDVLTAPGWLRPTHILDARFHVLPDAPSALAHNMQITFHAGTAEAMARVAVLDAPEIKAGASGWVQIRLVEPIAVAKGDPFIARIPSPSATIGGGTIVEPHPRRHRRFQAKVIEGLGVLERGTPAEILLHQLRSAEPVELGELARRSGMPLAEVQKETLSLLKQGTLIQVQSGLSQGDGSSPSAAHLPQTALLMTSTGWDALAQRVQGVLAGHHAEFSLKRGMAKEEVRTRLGIEPRVFSRALARLREEGMVVEEGPLLHLPTHRVSFTPEQERGIAELLAILDRAGASPPSRQEVEVRTGLSRAATEALVEDGRLVEVEEDIAYSRKAYDETVSAIVVAIRERGTITVAQVRDMFHTSRKYALAILEHLDDRKVTRRVGDERILY